MDFRSPRLTIGMAAASAFFATLLLALWSNGFPAAYHPDEPAKVEQVVTGHRSYSHPSLMLNATETALRLVGGARTPEHVVHIGRCLSAGYVAASVALLVVVTGCYGGPGAAWLAAFLLSTDSQAALAGHFFKEDPLLLLGLSATLAAGVWRARRPDRGLSLFVMGAAAGFAVSTKYIGVVALLYACLLESFLMSPAPKWRRLARLGAAALGTLLLINAVPLIAHGRALFDGLLGGGTVAVLGNDSVQARVPHLFYFGMTILYVAVPVVAGFAWWLWELAHEPGPASARMDRWLFALMPVGFVVLYSFSALTAVRYFLPMSLLFSCAGALGIVSANRRLTNAFGRTGRVAAGLLVGSCAAFQLPPLVTLERGFARDDRAELRAWIAAELPRDAVLAVDGLAYLADPPLAAGQRVLTAKFAADLGTFDALRTQGVTHVVVCWFYARRYSDPAKRPSPGDASNEAFARRRDFYGQLVASSPSLWHREITQPHALRPGFDVFALPPAKVPPAASAAR